MYRVASINEDGTAAVTTPIPRPGESDREAAERVAAGIPGGEVLSAGLVAALRRADTPAPGSVVSRTELVRRTYPLTIALATAGGPDAPAMRAKWDRLLAPLAHFDTVRVTDPTIAALCNLAVADGLLTADQAAAVTATD